VKKTLIVCGQYPSPENAGSSIRTMNFVRFFKERGIVDLAYTEGTKRLELDGETFRKEYPLKKIDYPAHFGARTSMLLKGFPYPICQYEPGSEAVLLSAIERNDYQYVLVRYAVNSSWLFRREARHTARVIVDLDDLISESLYETYFDPTSRPDKRLIRAINRRLLKQYEKKCARFGASIFCSETDLHKIARHRQNNNAFVVPNVYPSESFFRHDFGDGFLNPNRLLFVGTLSHAPNVTGLMWFVDEVYPHLQRKYPDAGLLIVGQSPNEAARSIQQKCSNIELRANVPNLKPFYEDCKAVVVPLLAGGGTRIKILEAALANRPILSTPKGAEGLDLQDGVHLHLFRSGHEFIEKYEQLNKTSAYHSMVENARKLVLNKYTTDGFNEAMSRVVAHIDEAKSYLV